MPSNPASTVDLETLFSAPVAAAINADFMAARQFAQYIQEYGFSPPNGDSVATGGTGFLGDLRMVSFAFDQSGGCEAGPRVVEIPALSMVPLPLLQVQSAEFRFAVRVLQGEQDETPRPLRLLAESGDSGLEQPVPYRWRAMLVSSPEVGSESSGAAQSLDANIRVHLNINRADIPAGISRLLALMNENLSISTPQDK